MDMYTSFAKCYIKDESNQHDEYGWNVYAKERLTNVDNGRQYAGDVGVVVQSAITKNRGEEDGPKLM